MQPASYVGRTNYELLGNNRVGETHQSRMARVNASNLSGPTLVGELAQQPVINGSNMGITAESGWGGVDVITYGLVGGIVGGIASSFVDGDKKRRGYGALVGGALGAIAALTAHRGTPMSDSAVRDFPFLKDSWGWGTTGAVVGGILTTFGVAYFRTKTNGTKAGKKGTLMGQLEDPLTWIPALGFGVLAASSAGLDANKLYAGLVGGAMGLLGVAMVNQTRDMVYD
jgi:hypothetical protein